MFEFLFTYEILWWVIWWDKTVAWFDVWSIEHFLSGISIWYLVMTHNFKVFQKKIGFDPEIIKTRYFDVIWVLFLAYFWETIEHYLETGLLGGGVEYWFQGVEFWWNRIITDPLLLVLWYLLVRKYKHIVKHARFLSVIWLFFHVFVFPHSMYLHNWL